MPDKPIIFSAPMIRALLDGRKTQTRRVLKPQPIAMPSGWGLTTESVVRFAPGDRLWVQEAFCGHIGILPSDFLRAPRTILGGDGDTHLFYRADDPTLPFSHSRWRSGAQMPRWASRMTLGVTEVRVQRLQEITEADAIAEGVDAISMEDVPRQAAMSRRADFAALWNTIHGPGAWDENPWVCALTFKVHRCNIDQMER